MACRANGTGAQQLPRRYTYSWRQVAIDVYLQINGIKGGSTDAEHKGDRDHFGTVGRDSAQKCNRSASSEGFGVPYGFSPPSELTMSV
jgi:type VI protein secretion system component Hcp